MRIASRLVFLIRKIGFKSSEIQLFIFFKKRGVLKLVFRFNLKNLLEKVSFLLFRFLWTSKENEKSLFKNMIKLCCKHGIKKT